MLRTTSEGEIICLVDFMPIFNVSCDKRVFDSFLGRLLPKLILSLVIHVCQGNISRSNGFIRHSTQKLNRNRSNNTQTVL